MFEMLLNFGLLLLFNPLAMAQGLGDSLVRIYQSPCQSEWVKYNNLTEKYSIVRSNSQNHVVNIQERDLENGQNRHTFIVRRNAMVPFAAFSTSFVQSIGPYIESSIEIYDMRLFDGSCYFCGEWESPFGPLSFGFVGHFNINDMMSGEGFVYYQVFGEIDRLTRIAISKDNGSSLLISAIGKMNYSNKACILELEDTGSSWTKRIDTIKENYEIVFSDIMAFRDSLTLLAQYSCVNEDLPGSLDYDFSHQIFLIDRFGLSGCYNSYNPIPPHYMFHYVMPASENYIFHYNKAPMRLFHINDKNKEFGVAFGVEKSDGSVGGIRLFQFHNARQYDNSFYYKTGLHAEIRDVGNLYGSDSLFVLSQDNSHINGLITVPLLSSALYDVIWLTKDVYTFNTLTQKIGGRHIDVSGHDGARGFHLYDQNIQSLAMPSCFEKSVNQYEVFPEKRADILRVHWVFGDRQSLEWKVAEVTKLNLSLDVICDFCDE